MIHRRHGEGRRDGIHGKEMAELDLQHGESAQQQRQQPHMAVVDPTSQQKHVEQGDRIGNGHEHPAHPGIARHAGSDPHHVHIAVGHAQSIRCRRQLLRQMGSDDQQIKRKMAVGVGAPGLALHIP